MIHLRLFHSLAPTPWKPTSAWNQSNKNREPSVIHVRPSSLPTHRIDVHHWIMEMHYAEGMSLFSNCPFIFCSMEGSLMGSGTRVTASMYLFQSSSYTRSYPAGSVTLPMGSALYVGVFVSERDPSFALVLEDCYTTYSSNPDEGGAEPGFLIQNRFVFLLMAFT